jgi:hypothetical protein
LEAFPDVRDNKGVIPDENIKWFIHPTHFYPEDGPMCFQSVGNTAHIHAV